MRRKHKPQDAFTQTCDGRESRGGAHERTERCVCERLLALFADLTLLEGRRTHKQAPNQYHAHYMYMYLYKSNRTVYQVDASRRPPDSCLPARHRSPSTNTVQVV